MNRIKKVLEFFKERPLLTAILGFILFPVLIFLFIWLSPEEGESYGIADEEYQIENIAKFPVEDYYFDDESDSENSNQKQQDTTKDNEKDKELEALKNKLREMEELYKKNLKRLYANELNKLDGSYKDKEDNIVVEGEVVIPRDLLEKQAKEITGLQKDALKENDQSYVDNRGNVRNKNGGMIIDNKSLEDLGKEIVRVQDELLKKNPNTTLDENGDLVNKNGDIIVSRGQIKDRASKIQDLYNEILQENPNYTIDNDGNVRDEKGNIIYSRDQIEKLADMGATLKNGNLYDRNGNLINKDGVILSPTYREIRVKPQEQGQYYQPPKKRVRKKSRKGRTLTPQQLAKLSEKGGSEIVIGGQATAQASNGVYDFGVGGFSNYNEKDIASNEHRLYRTITANKNIPAVLNNPISSQISGKVTAMVTEDIYANMGRAVLIPKGSYVIGYYRNNNKIGEYRLDLVWTRIITPQGVNLILTKEARGSDVKGYSGLVGEVIEKNWEKYGMPILLSTISNIGIMGGAGALSNLASSQNNPYGAWIMGELGDTMQKDVGAVVKQYLQDHTNVKPIIIIREGSRVFISPNVDIFVPYPKKKEVMLEFFNPSPRSQYDQKEKILTPDNRKIENYIEYPMESENENNNNNNPN